MLRKSFLFILVEPHSTVATVGIHWTSVVIELKVCEAVAWGFHGDNTFTVGELNELNASGKVIHGAGMLAVDESLDKREHNSLSFY